MYTKSSPQNKHINVTINKISTFDTRNCKRCAIEKYAMIRKFHSISKSYVIKDFRVLEDTIINDFVFKINLYFFPCRNDRKGGRK